MNKRIDKEHGQINLAGACGIRPTRPQIYRTYLVDAIVHPISIVLGVVNNVSCRDRIFCASFLVVQVFISHPAPAEVGFIRCEFFGDSCVPTFYRGLIRILRLRACVCGVLRY